MSHGMRSPARQDQLPIAPDTRKIYVHSQDVPFVEKGSQLGGPQCWRVVVDLEQAAALAAYSGIELAHTSPAR